MVSVPPDLQGLSSNWKILQARLKPATHTLEHRKSEVEDHLSRKRKRLLNAEQGQNNESATGVHRSDKSLSPKAFSSRKRPKMDELALVSAHAKHKITKFIPRSLSMPSLRGNFQEHSIGDTQTIQSTLGPSKDFPDIENEGVSERALPGKFVALDCEMVGIGPEPDRDSALARVSIVNFHGHQVYDSYVQVPQKIEVTDYRTSISGIEPKHLIKGFARTFDEVRNDVKILLAGRILVGHAIKNDLNALILRHDSRYIRDTSKFSKFRALAAKPGWTPGLKMLTDKLLGVQIQAGAHSSVEDARATMALYRLKKVDFEQEIRLKFGNASHHKEFPKDVPVDNKTTKIPRNRKQSKKRSR